MDINKYIGKFLLKNKYCSLPGLGVFDLKKESARVNLSSETISGPVYKISFNPVGTIDDTFASFIASSENVSISNASNNIREYCIMVKEELAKNGHYEIDHLGRFTMQNTKIVFNQSNDLDLGVEPAPLPPLVERAKTPEAQATKPDYNYPPARRQKQFPVKKILIPVGIIAVLAVCAYFGYTYYQTNKVVEETVPIEEQFKKADSLAVKVDSNAIRKADSLKAQTDTLHKDSTSSANAQPATSIPAAPSTSAYHVAILSFDTEAAAQAKANKLKTYGNKASVLNNNGRFVVVIDAVAADTTKLVDSLRRFFNPKGHVFIMK